MSGETVSSQRAFKVEVSPTLGACTGMTGGAVQQPSSKFYQGGAATPELVRGRRVISDVTVTKGFKAARSPQLIQSLIKAMNSTVFKIVKQPLDEDGIAVGRALVYTGCRLVTVTPPAYNEQSDADAATLEFVFTVANVT